MSASDYAIRVEGLGKQFRIGVEQAGGMSRYKSLRDSLGGVVKSPWQTARSAMFRKAPDESNSFWALKDVSFDVKRGEVVGIIGRNGAGKSTLLKILSRITKPTAGHVELRGRVGSLLEVGTGFHPELTGRENIYLNGAILGMTRAEVRGKFDEIVAFSEIEKFLDTAVKHYSSGMYTRLAFAVAAHLEPEVLIVDEVLAVGDAAFQKKCLGRMKDVADHGRTVLFVSHNFEAVKTLCTRGVLLDRGSVSYDGDADRAVREAVAATVRASLAGDFRVHDVRPTAVRPRSITIGSAEESTAGIIDFDYPIVASLELDGPVEPETTFAAQVLTPGGLQIFNSFYADRGENAPLVAGQTRRVSVTIPARFLTAGTYELTFAYMRPNADLFWVTRDAWFTVDELESFRNEGLTVQRTGLVSITLPWSSS